MKWNVIWRQAMTGALLDGEMAGEKRTVCFPVIAPYEFENIRLTFSNAEGYEKAVIGEVVISGPNQCIQVTFDGNTKLILNPGEQRDSDAARCSIKSGQEFEVRIYYESRVSWGNGIEEEARVVDGNQVHTMIRSTIPKEPLHQKDGIYPFVPLLSHIETEGRRATQQIVAFGDSITAMSRWTKPLARKLYQRYGMRYILLNSGIPGNCMLYDVPGEMRRVFGIRGTDRFTRDVEEIPNLHAVIIGLGINDMSFLSSETKEVINQQHMQEVILEWTQKLHDNKVRVVVSTVTPRKGCDPEFTDEMEELRQDYNNWLRSNNELFDYLIDFDLTIRDPDKPFLVREEYHQGDHLHPNKLGGEILADSINLELITGEKN